jgi:hypothetical protein
MLAFLDLQTIQNMQIYTWSSTYDHKKIINKLIINQDVLLRTPITQVRRHIDDEKILKNKL